MMEPAWSERLKALVLAMYTILDALLLSESTKAHGIIASPTRDEREAANDA